MDVARTVVVNPLVAGNPGIGIGLRVVNELIDISGQEYSLEPGPDELDLCEEIKRAIMEIESRTGPAPAPLA